MAKIESTLRNEFFPEGHSPTGSQKKFNFSVRNYLREVLKSSTTIKDYVEFTLIT
jgi:hypothetical protein